MTSFASCAKSDQKNTEESGQTNTEETYTITYIDAPAHNNPTTYTPNDYIKLQRPIWNGLSFSHWTDQQGNVVTEIPQGTTGNIVLTANWKVLRNLATPSEDNTEFYNAFAGDDGFVYFFYDLGTIEHVVLDEINPSLYYKSEGVSLNMTLNKTVSISEETAKSIANIVSTSISSTTAWEKTKNWASTHTENWNTQFGGSIGGENGFAKLLGLKIEGHHNFGGEDSTTKGWASSTSGSTSQGETNENTISTALAYKQEITSEITENYYINEALPSGYYACVHAGNVRVFAVISYEIETGCLYLNAYSRLDNMHSMVMYYENVNQLNNPSTEGLDFEISEERKNEIVNLINNSYYVKYLPNGGTGTMHTSIHTIDKEEKLPKNEFTREGYVFKGWGIKVMPGVEVLLFTDEQSVINIAEAGKTVTLHALWEPVAYTIHYDANGGTGTMPATSHSANVEYQLPAATFTYNNYIFLGWNTSPDGTGTYYSDESIINNLTGLGSSVTLYACWGSDGLTYSYNNATQSYFVTGVDSCEDTNVIIPSVHNGLPVTTIGESAFRGCDFMTSVEIPGGIICIENGAFRECSSLERVIFSDTSQLKTIGKYAFSECTDLEQFVIPASVTTINDGIFAYCTSLGIIEVADGNTSFKIIDGDLYDYEGFVLVQYAIGKNDTILFVPSDVQRIQNSAFEGCSSLVAVSIPLTISSIGTNAFAQCKSLQQIDFSIWVGHNVLTEIPSSAFVGCTSLKLINIPYSVTKIGSHAFYGCVSLNTIDLPSGVTSIGEAAFYGCTSLANINIPENVTTIGDYAFCYCSSLTSINIPASVTFIGRYAFYGCSALTHAYFDNKIWTYSTTLYGPIGGLVDPLGGFKDSWSAAFTLTQSFSIYYWYCN